MSPGVDSVQHQARPVTMCDVPVSEVKGAKLCCKRLIGEVVQSRRRPLLGAVKVLVGTFNQKKALVGAFSVIVKTDGSFAALIVSCRLTHC